MKRNLSSTEKLAKDLAVKYHVSESRVGYAMYQLGIYPEPKKINHALKSAPIGFLSRINMKSEYVVRTTVGDSNVPYCVITNSGISAIEKKLAEDTDQVPAIQVIPVNTGMTAIDEIVSMYGENKTLKDQLIGKNAEIKDLNEKLDHMTQIAEDLEDKNAELKDTNANLMKEKQELIKQSSIKTASVVSKIDAALEELAKLENAINAQYSELEDLKRKKDDLLVGLGNIHNSIVAVFK